MEAVTRKLDFVLSTKTPDYLTTFAPQVSALHEEAKANRTGLIERVAYTWFNRFTALRYLDAKGWHPFRARVLTPATPSETQPELLKLMRTGALPEDLHCHTNVGRLNELLDGRLPTAIPNSDPQGEVYRHLVLAACRFYHSLLPDLFEKLDDETELLLPDDLLTEHSVVHGFRTQITDKDCAEVEVLGWLYQFYIAEKKDQVMARKSAVPTEDIPAVTQLFTPHWIVRYLVENSLGRLWLLNRPSSRLRGQMPYYIEGEPETDFLKIGKPEEIRVIDPAVGSGHMLTYAFDLLYAIYEEEGYGPSDIAGLILTHNLHGLDIDPRAAQLASLALVLKAREKSRRFLQADKLVQPHILAFQNVHFEEADLREYISSLKLGELFNQPVLHLMRQFEDATNFGSLIQPCPGETEIKSLRRAIEMRDLGSQLFLRETHLKVLRVLEQAEALTQRYHVVVANPPYMGSKPMNTVLQRSVELQYEAGKADLYGAFMLRNAELALDWGYVGMITIPNWMFLAAFEELRKSLIPKLTIKSLVHNGRGVWGPDFGSCAFVYKRHTAVNVRGSYKRLFKKQGEVNSNDELIRRFFDNETFPIFQANQAEYAKIPGVPVAYWVSSSTRRAFGGNPPLEKFAQTRKGMVTADNEKYVRLWFELSEQNIGFNCSDRNAALDSGRKWFPYLKGGGFRKWYGNSSTVVDWQNDGQRLRTARHPTEDRILATNFNLDYIFKPNVNWGAVTISAFSARVSFGGEMFDAGGSACFPAQQHIFGILAFLNSVLTSTFLSALNPTLNFQAGNIGNLPLVVSGNETNADLAETAVRIARTDWDNFETSWDFQIQPLLQPELKGTTLEASWLNWEAQCVAAIARMQELETENNRLFIAAYGLEGELQPKVPQEQITLARAETSRDMKAFLSYAIGCMMGRYSLDQSGLILADAGDTLSDYLTKVGKPLEQLTFTPDEDGIIPILDGEWFEEDIVARTREFLRVTFGKSTLNENLRFIEESLGKDLRKYYLTDFYKNHTSNDRAYGYKKRPIYWMVQSPQKGFSALIYLHRYTRDTMNLVLNHYLRPYQEKLRSRLEQLGRVQLDEGVSTRDKTAARKENDKLTKVLRECEEWERQTILPLAQQRIELDLDHGVKVNYQKLGEALATIPGLASPDE
jgi:hypothetical protein